MLLQRLEKLGRAIEDSVLVILLVAMIGLASLQILLRNGFDTGFIWADELLRLMLLWLALFGAVAASRADRHINIDVLSRALAPRARLGVSVLIDLFTAAMCGLLCFHSARFVSDAYEFDDTLLGDLPAWWFQIVLPICFGMMCYRYLLMSGGRLIAFLRGDTAVAPTIDPALPGAAED